MALNENLENLVNKATDAVLAAGQAAKALALISKKRAQIVKEQEVIRRNYARLGKVYYKDYITDEEPDEAEYTPICDAISESFRRINQLKSEIDDAKAASDPAPVDPVQVVPTTDEADDVEIVPVDEALEDFFVDPAVEEAAEVTKAPVIPVIPVGPAVTEEVEAPAADVEEVAAAVEEAAAVVEEAAAVVEEAAAVVEEAAAAVEEAEAPVVPVVPVVPEAPEE